MEQKKLINPENNKLQISKFRDARSFVFLSKIYMKKFEEIEVHALGEAISTAVRVADQLQKFEYATILKISTFTLDPDFKEGQTPAGDAANNSRKKIKMVITLKRAADFMEKTKNIN